MTAGEAVEAALRGVGEELRNARETLNELDSAAGDGDLGLTASSIGQALIELAPEVRDMEPAAALRRLGMEVGQRAPSTFGTLVSIGFLAAARSAPSAKQESAVEAASRCAAAAEAGIALRGKVARGDKSMLDALGPAADALAAASADEASLAEALSAAAEAAEAGAEATAAMDPRVGRQAWLTDRARGQVDPGARAVALMLAAAARAVSSESG